MLLVLEYCWYSSQTEHTRLATCTRNEDVETDEHPRLCRRRPVNGYLWKNVASSCFCCYSVLPCDVHACVLPCVKWFYLRRTALPLPACRTEEGRPRGDTHFFGVTRRPTSARGTPSARRREADAKSFPHGLPGGARPVLHVHLRTSIPR